MKRTIALLLTILLFTVILASCDQKTSLQLDKTELQLTVGDSAQLSAGSAVRVNWSSSDDTVAAVHAGAVSAKAPGTAVITASLESGESASCTVTVTDKRITAIKLNPTSARLDEGSTIQLTATYSPADASHVVLSWSSSDEDVASVDQQGYVTAAYTEGTAIITCKSDNGVAASCTVSVGTAPQAPTAPPTQPPTEAPTQPPATQAPQDDTPPNDTPQDDGGSHDTNGFIFPNSSIQFLTTEEIASTFAHMSRAPVSGSYQQDAVNEIFARHGYVFRTPSIRAYYEAQSWYTPDASYDGSLNPIEQYNITLLSKY